MSTENVLRFLDKVSRNAEVSKQLAGADKTATAWVATGKSAGYDFNVDDLRTVAEAVLEKKLQGESFVTELLGTGELSDKQLEAVAGGVLSPGILDVKLVSRVASIGGGWASAHVKDGGDPTIGKFFGPGIGIKY